MTEALLRDYLRAHATRAYAAGWNDREHGRGPAPADVIDDAEAAVMPIAADLVQKALEEGFAQARQPLAAPRPMASKVAAWTAVFAVGIVVWAGVFRVVAGWLFAL